VVACVCVEWLCVCMSMCVELCVVVSFLRCVILSLKQCKEHRRQKNGSVESSVVTSWWRRWDDTIRAKTKLHIVSSVEKLKICPNLRNDIREWLSEHAGNFHGHWSSQGVGARGTLPEVVLCSGGVNPGRPVLALNLYGGDSCSVVPHAELDVTDLARLPLVLQLLRTHGTECGFPGDLEASIKRIGNIHSVNTTSRTLIHDVANKGSWRGVTPRPGPQLRNLQTDATPS